MEILLFLSCITCIIVMFYKLNNREKSADIANNLTVYEDHSQNKYNYVIGYDPINSDTEIGDYTIFRRCSLLVDNIIPTRYSNGKIATVRIYLDIDHYVPNDLITIEDKLNLIILSKEVKLKNHFYYVAAPLEDLTESDFSFAKIGAKVYKLDRKLTEAENTYFLKNKLDLKTATYKFKDFNPPYRPHRQGGSASNYKSSSDDIVDDFVMNPLLSPISPVSIWNNDDSSSSSSSSWDASDNSSSSYDSSSYDSGDSGGGSCD